MEISEKVKIFLENNIDYIEESNIKFKNLELFFNNMQNLSHTECKEIAYILQTVLNISNLKENAELYIMKGFLEAIDSWQASSAGFDKYEIGFEFLMDAFYTRSYLWYLLVDIELMVKKLKPQRFKILPPYDVPFGFIHIKWIG